MPQSTPLRRPSGRRAGRTVTIALSVLAAVGAALVVATPAMAANPTATYRTDSSWGTGWIGYYTIANPTTTTLSGWRLEFDLPASHRLTSLWNGKLVTTGTHYTVTPESWNNNIAPGGSADIGFEGVYSGTLVPPSNCRLNGLPCSGGGSTTTTTTAPTTTTTTTQATTTTTAQATTTTTVRPTTTTALPATTTTTAPAATTTTMPSTTTTTIPPGGSAGSFSPYVDVTLWPPFDLAAAAQATGGKSYNLGFVVGVGSGGCAAAWGGVYPMSDRYYESQIAALRAVGGDVRPSFGGAAGSELAQVCTSVSALTAQYQAVIDQYGLTRIDFDIEGAAAAQPASIARRSQAIANLQATARAAGRPLSVSLTLAVLPTGLTPDGINVVKSAITYGAKIDIVNVMAMDYGDSAAPNPEGRMGAYANQAAQSTHDQLVPLYPSATDAQVWAMVGVTPMIGVNDVQSEVFRLADAQVVVAFAQQKKLGMVSMWSSTRDKQCPGGAQTYADPTCSSIVQAPWDFSKTFGAYKG